MHICGLNSFLVCNLIPILLASMSTFSMEKGIVLHIVMFPWLAMGHIIPFFNLSKYIAQKGHRISFISTPRNLRRLPKVPPALSSLIDFISLPLPHIDPLPDYAESSTDIPPLQSQFLKKAFDLLEQPITTFLENTSPDWIIYDYAPHWLPSLAAKLGISHAFLSLFNAAFLAFLGPPSVLLNDSGESSRMTPEDLAGAPKWVPFESNIKLHFYEAVKALESAGGNESGTDDAVRFGVTIGESDAVFVRSCDEFEPEWFNLLKELYQTQVLPIGFLPSLMADCEENNDDENWVGIKQWLDRQRLNSVVYVALGSEAVLSQEQLKELALGLEQSKLPFFWVLRKPAWLTQNELEMLPDGFQERVKDRGMVYLGWAPQVKILGHDAIGGFLTHCGWNSVIEGLGFGRVLILFPVLNDQAMNARLLEGKKLGVEVPLNEQDGSLSRDSVTESVIFAMVGEEGELLRANARKMRGIFGDRNRNDLYINGFVRYLEENKRSYFIHREW